MSMHMSCTQADPLLREGLPRPSMQNLIIEQGGLVVIELLSTVLKFLGLPLWAIENRCLGASRGLFTT